MIRPATHEDMPSLARLFLAARRETFYWVDPTLFELNDLTHQSEGEQIWVAEHGDTLCGFISIWLPDSFVHHLYVAPEWQGRGLGRALLASGLAACPLPASLKVAERNTAAIAFYRRLGWQVANEFGQCPLTGPWRRMVMSERATS
ncbi:MAG: GNAT family N-acetyltransferase [Aeromonas sp.]